MKKLRSCKWLIVAGLVAVVVALGAVACGSSDDDRAYVGQGTAPGASVQNGAGGMGDGGMMSQKPDAQKRQAAQDRRMARAERQEALLDNLRDSMSAEDQAVYDQLTATIEQQRTAAQQARQKLADTLKELRTLVDKYLELDGAGTN